MNPARKIRTAFRMAALFENWPLMWAAKLGFIPRGKIIEAAFRDGRRLSFRIGADETAFGENILLEGYFHPAVPWRELTHVVDIGANVGCFALWLFRMNPAAKLVLLEPDPETAALLKRNLAANPELKATLFEEAVWTGTGRLRFFRDRNNAGMSGFCPDERHRTETCEVRAVSVNELFDRAELREADLVKMDCEGAEYEILPFIREEHWQRIPRLLVEIHEGAGRDPGSLTDLLIRRGFVVHRGGRNPHVVWAVRSR